MPLIQPALSSRRGAFRDHYHGKTRVNMSFHDTSQQPARPAGVSGRSAAAGTAATGSKGPALSIVMPAPHIVMPGLVPGISLHRFSQGGRMDTRNKSGYDGGRRRPEPRPARVGAHADRPRFSRQARCVLHPSRARNQAREPRRRRHAPAPARKCAR